MDAEIGTIGPLRRLGREVWSRPWLGILAVLFVGVGQRLQLPWVPLADPDTWGYLNPALQHLAGLGLVQTDCRGLAYPLFLLGVLGASQSFTAIAIVQHLLGLLSGVVWLLCFRLWLGWWPTSHARSPLVWWIAALGLGLYLGNPATLALETQLRPEAIFPLFGLGQVAATLWYALARWKGGSAFVTMLAAGLAVFLSLICLGLKPSWGFAAAVPWATILFGTLLTGASASRRFGSLAAAFLAAGLWSWVVPPAIHWVPEKACGGFLAGTLFTVHADIIARAMHERSDQGKLDPAEEEFLRKLDARLAESRALEKSSYKILDHDPDYLFYLSDTLVKLPGVAPDDRLAQASYLRAAYFDALWSQPWPMARKVLRQLVAACGDASESLFSVSVLWQPMFERTRLALESAPVPAIPVETRTSLDQLLVQVDLLAASQPKSLKSSLAPPRWVLRGPLAWLLSAAVIVGGGALLASAWLRRAAPLRPWLPALRSFGIVWACAVGSTLTVAVVHSFDIDRYLHLQSSINALLLALSVALVVGAAPCLLPSRAKTISK